MKGPGRLGFQEAYEAMSRGILTTLPGGDILRILKEGGICAPGGTKPIAVLLHIMQKCIAFP